MIKSVTVINFLGETLKMDLRDPWSSGFAIEEISGLGPGKATVNVSDYSIMNGGRYTSSRVPSRNIVLKLRYMWANTIEEARQKSYRYFPLTKQLTLIFETDSRLAAITGYVESNEPDIFSSESKTTVSIICPDPYFYSGTETTVFSGIGSAFEFPFCNDSLVENQLVMSEIENETERVVKYYGDADVGVTIRIHAVGPAKDVTIYNLKTREAMALDIDIQAKDDIIISTVRGSKSIYRYRDGVYTNVLPLLSSIPDWFTLERGDNTFVYTAKEGSENLQFKLENKVAYEGV